MKKGGEENEINILISKTPKKYSNSFLEELENKRISIISSIVLRLANESKIWIIIEKQAMLLWNVGALRFMPEPNDHITCWALNTILD